MEEKNDIDYKTDDAMLPGFRFHPTDEELVGFYLKRKIQQRPLPIELIKQVDIYKYDPWDLPELATTGEKEWYFYCPRDRKYRNSARPNRVTVAGFWKATGTDRPIYSSDGTRCIGLKKSLVFYRGRAAKAIKTDWMMHEFRLPSLGQPSLPNNKKLPDKSLPPNDAWAICRIFKKTNSMAQRAVLSHSHSLICPLGGTSSPSDHGFSHDQFSWENISCTTEIGSVFQLSSSNDHLQQTSAASFSASDFPPSYRPIINCALYKPSLPNGGAGDLPNNFMFTPLEMSTPAKSTTVDTSPILLNPALVGDISKASDQNIEFEGSQEYFNNTIFSISLPQNDVMGSEDAGLRKNLASIPENQHRGGIRSLQGFLFSLPSEILDVWKPNLPWDSPTCPSEMSTTYSTNKCYT